MKPNKIYLSKLVMAGAEILDKPVSDGDIEYIRKDFLLEWAKELEQKRLMGYIMFDELINKLEQL